MRILLTGMKGTLAPVMAEHLRTQGNETVAWDRSSVDPENISSSTAFLERTQPEAIVHLAMGSENWAAQLAAYARTTAVPLIFTSTAMVFDHHPDGPHRPTDLRSAQDDYGRYKMRCEDTVLEANPDAIIARIGWQIDPSGRGNNMLAQLEAQQQQQGHIRVSEQWIPACSFMSDTAAALWTLLERNISGTYHLDSNALEARPFPRIVAALSSHFGRGWTLEHTTDYRHDQRLIGHETLMSPLSSRLPELGV